MDTNEDITGYEYPEYFEYYWDKAEEYEAQKDYDNALECYSKCFDLSNTYDNASYDYWWLMGMPEMYDSFRAGALIKIAEIYYTLSDYPTAAEHYLSVIKCIPNSLEVRKRYAEIKALIEE